MRCFSGVHICRGPFMILITAVCLPFNNTDGVWCRESPNEVSPFTEHWGQPKHPAPLPERSCSRPCRRRRLRWIHSAREHHAPLPWLEQTDVWERHATWTTCAARWLQGDEPGRNPMCEIPHLARLNRRDNLFRFVLILFLFRQTAEVPWLRSILQTSDVIRCDLASWIQFLFLLFQIQDGSWHESRFFFHTQDSRQLPIVDIQILPAPRPSSQRHIEIGPVCFFWHQRPWCVACAHEH